MKKFYFLLVAFLWHCGVAFSAVDYRYVTGDLSVINHNQCGSYEGRPCFVVSSDETIAFTAPTNRDSELYIDDSKVGSGKASYQTKNLKVGVLHKVHLTYVISNKIWDSTRQEYKGSVTTYTNICYIIVNTLSQTACSQNSKQIGLWHGNISRWERSRDGGSTWTNISCTDYQYTEENPAAGTAMYRVLGTDNTYSDVVTITYVDAVPSTIQALPATSTKTVDESITLTADVVDDNYSYQWKKDGKDISGATSRTYSISPIKSSHAGNYTCYVSNGCNGVTSTTAKLVVNKCAQVIDFPEIPVQTYSTGLTYALPKITDKGLTITYQSMNTSVATVSGNVLTIKAPGTAIIAASQVGDADYLEATQVSRTLTVNKRSQIITFDELPEKTYEDLPFTLPQKTDEGLTISYTSTNPTVATVSGNTVTILKPGSTDIIASQAGDATHYPAADVSQTLVVKKAAQEITFGALSSKTYGDAPFELNKVSNKNLTIVYTSSDASIASVEGNVVTINHPGSVTITASQAGNAYYLAAESVSQELIIHKANQSINFPAIESRAYDSEDFELSAQTDKGQTISYESTNPSVATVSGNIVHITGAGTTEISASQAGNEYYNAAPTVSQTLTITKANQIITFPELDECIYGQAPITLNATVNSDVQIEYESSDYSIATISGDVLTIVGAGQCYITASAAGNKNYYTASPVERKLVVAKAQSTIDFAPLVSEYTYGDSPIALVASSSYGQVSFSSSNPEKLLIVGTNAIIQGAGKFTITATLAGDANHTSTSASQEITINKASLTVSANNASRLYGEANPELTYTYKGFVNGDTKLDLTTTVQISSEATLTSPVGTYDIVPTATTDDNYEIICKKGVLTVEQAPLNISANATREYGEANPEFIFSYSGFKNNEDSTVLDVLPQAYTTAKKTSPAGTYPVYASGAMAKNYSISYEEGALVVNKAPLTVKVLDVTRKRLEENPVFERVISGFKLEDTLSDIEKLPSIQCDATVDSPAGTYPIILLNDGYAQNYDFVLINGTLTVEKLKYTLTAQPQDPSMGLVSGSGTYDEEEIITITATPKDEYRFISWSDGVVQNPRQIKLTQDTTFVALFEKVVHCLNVSYLTTGGADLGEMTTDNSSVWTYSSQYGAVGKKQRGGRGCLLTPEYDLYSAVDVTISFQHTHKFAGNPSEELLLWVCPDANDYYNRETWHQLPIDPYASNNDWQYVYVSIKVPTEYVGGRTVFIFEYISTSTHYSTWEIKDLSITADCDAGPFALNVTCDPQVGSVNGENGTFEYGTTHTFTAIPNEGYHFVKWSDGNTQNPRTITLTHDMSLTAIFNINTYLLQVTCDANEGQVYGETGYFEHGTTHTITATPNNGYRFDKWSDGVQTNPRTITLTSDTILSALFIKTFNVSVTCDPSEGTIEGENGRFDQGTVLTFKAIPNEGYNFAQWSDGNTQNPRTITVQQDLSLRAVFALKMYLVQFFGFEDVLLEQQKVEHGKDAIAPEAPKVDHYNFVGWDREFSNVQSDLDVHAIYEHNTEGLEDIDGSSAPRKVMIDNVIYILRGDHIYTLTGQEIR